MSPACLPVSTKKTHTCHPFFSLIFSPAWMLLIGAAAIVRGRREDDVFDISRQPVDAITLQAGQSQAKDSQDTLQGQSLNSIKLNPFSQPSQSKHSTNQIKSRRQSDQSARQIKPRHQSNNSASHSQVKPLRQSNHAAVRSVSQSNSSANQIAQAIKLRRRSGQSASQISQPIKSNHSANQVNEIT